MTALYDAKEYVIAGLENQAEWWEHLGDAHRDYAALAREAIGLEEQLETLQRNAIRRFQIIYNESDINRMKLLAYDGIAEVTGNEWRDVRALNSSFYTPEGT